MENTLTKKQYVDFLKPNTLPLDVTITIKEGRQSVKALKRTENIMKVITTVLLYIAICALALIVVFPFYWMIITSLKSNMEIRQTTQTFFPEIVKWENYIEIFYAFDFTIYMGNTIVVAIFATLGTLITTIFAAFAFARLKFAGREALFMLFLATMMIPGEMMVISNYITVSSLNGKNTYWAMIVPFLISVYYIYLLRQNFKQIPNELYYAAKVDGTSDLKYLLKVMVPIAMPTLITITILKMMGAWNSYVWPTMITTTDDMRLITTGLRESFTSNEGRTIQGQQMAATTVVTAPLLIVFIVLRKYIMRGVSRSGIKG